MTTDPTKLTTDAVNLAVVHIRELYDLQFKGLELRLEQRFQAQQQAINTALIASNLKSDALADKIVSLTDRFNTTKGQSEGPDPVMAQLLRDLVDLKMLVTAQQGKNQGVNAAWGYLIGAIGLIASVIALVSRLNG